MMRSSLIRRVCVAAAVCAWMMGGVAAGAEKESLEKVLAEVRAELKQEIGQVEQWGMLDESWHGQSMLVEMVYNSGRRELALRLIDAADRAEPHGGMKSLRRKIARYELDVAAMEASYRAEMDAALADSEENFPADILQDTVMCDRVLPAYESRLGQWNSAGLYELFRQYYQGKPKLIEICRKYLGRAGRRGSEARIFVCVQVGAVVDRAA